MKKILAFLTALTFTTASTTTIISCWTIDIRIRQSFASWTYILKTDQPIFGQVFNNDKTINEPYFSYWFIQQILTSSMHMGTDKPWNQLLNNNSGIAWPYPNTTNIKEINSNWFDYTITNIQNGKINGTDLKTFFIYMTIYNPVIILENSQIFRYQYDRDQSAIKIEYLYKTTNDINNYIKTINDEYISFYKETIEVKYLKLIPYFLPTEEAKQRIKNLVDTLIRVLTIMSPTFIVPLNINTNR
ncbi:lipoprotein [Spiroplasma endosymbiont of Stenodema calcarata]|uniref:lipoprotein n=1 Tax=Spiroplasma endosymbiont of Stenodema calcarata TaxID=3139328 RepID=UPI003CCAE3C6